MTQTQSRDQVIIERYERDMANGRVFTLQAQAHRSFIGYRPVTNRQEFSALLGRLAKYAGTSDEAAQLVAAIIRKLHLYGNTEEMFASAYEAAAEAVRIGYTDVVALAAPDAPRRSQAERPYRLMTLLNLLDTIKDGKMGWCAQALLKRERGW